jgi:hypothetical protein
MGGQGRGVKRDIIVRMRVPCKQTSRRVRSYWSLVIPTHRSLSSMEGDLADNMSVT